jgi:hypothetical protein
MASAKESAGKHMELNKHYILCVWERRYGSPNPLPRSATTVVLKLWPSLLLENVKITTITYKV